MLVIDFSCDPILEVTSTPPPPTTPPHHLFVTLYLPLLPSLQLNMFVELILTQITALTLL